ncbi:MAG: glycosyltransferase family 2 protein [Phycisphaerales bacterium]|nr:glycosyltransferase family 2 protein [Phycisphaerales bacterium]
MSVVVAIPVYNEEKYVPRVIAHVLEYTERVLVIDDGSTDRTPELLDAIVRQQGGGGINDCGRGRVRVCRHERNMGYGRSTRDAFEWAGSLGVEWLITMDCDEQHEPREIPNFVRNAAAGGFDVVSGSRYLCSSEELEREGSPPPDRRRINRLMTEEINARLGLRLTDAFCGFKAYRVAAMQRLALSVDGYAFPMQFWVQAVAEGLRIKEVPVRLIYNDLNRTFGGPLNDEHVRLAHYRRVLHCELERCADRLPAASREGVQAGCAET